MERSNGWRQKLAHWSLRGGFFTSPQDVSEIVGPLAARVDALEAEVADLRAIVDAPRPEPR